MIVIVVWTRWDLKTYAWFWATLAILVSLHVPLIQYVPWTNTSYPGVVLLPFGLLDFAIMYGCIKVAEKLMKKDNESSSTS